MADCSVNQVDSNQTGLRFAEEECLGQLYPQADNKTVWEPLEPNTYSDFGGEITAVARNPINPSRQNQKGVTTDLAASGGFTQDFTLANSLKLLQGFFFASAREKPTTRSINAPIVAFNTVTHAGAENDTFDLSAGGAAFPAGAIILASNFGIPANNKIYNVVSSTGTSVVVDTPLVVEVPPADATLQVVGHTFAAGDIAMALVGGLPTLQSTVFDFTTLGLIEGEWVFLGGDASTAHFPQSHGFARIGVGGLTAHALTFDKVDWTPAAEAGAGLSIQMFIGLVIKNEDDPALIVRRSYHLERTLSKDTTGSQQSEIIVGAVADQFTLTVNDADKVTGEMTFVGTDTQARTGTDGLLYGDRPDIDIADAFNTSSDFSRIKLSLLDADDANPVPLFAFATAMTIVIKNNVTAAKAIGTLGAIDMTVGSFDVSGSLTAYFSDVTAVQAVRNNSSCTLDMIAVKGNIAVLFDVPLLTLGNGRLSVQKDNPITLPLDTNAAQSPFGNTLTFMSFPYIPQLASS